MKHKGLWIFLIWCILSCISAYPVYLIVIQVIKLLDKMDLKNAAYLLDMDFVVIIAVILLYFANITVKVINKSMHKRNEL